MILGRGMMSLSNRWVTQRGRSLLAGVLQDRISGEVGRQQKSYPLGGDGKHCLGLGVQQGQRQRERLRPGLGGLPPVDAKRRWWFVDHRLAADHLHLRPLRPADRQGFSRDDNTGIGFVRRGE